MWAAGCRVHTNARLRRALAYCALGAIVCACAQPHVATIGREHPSKVALRAAPPLSAALRLELQHELDAILSVSGSHSLCVLDERGVRVYDRDGNAALPPASAQKLIVASTVLRDLGPNYRFPTTLAAPERFPNGVLRADLWLIGSGDPVLVTNDLRGGVKVLKRQGLRAVAGRVRVDATFLEGPERNPFWEPSDAQYGFSAATSGISLDQDSPPAFRSSRRAVR
jgi:D-alanyl-D-alanine carboxypeptidase/D-alanyl-D-alanine-endopeptidase (penicillin-binding protein 4)